MLLVMLIRNKRFFICLVLHLFFNILNAAPTFNILNAAPTFNILNAAPTSFVEYLFGDSLTTKATLLLLISFHITFLSLVL